MPITVNCITETMKYIKRKDGEGFEVPLGKRYRLACCDCGLVHDVVWVYEKGRLGMAATRNNRATAARRRGRNAPTSRS